MAEPEIPGKAPERPMAERYEWRDERGPWEALRPEDYNPRETDRWFPARQTEFAMRDELLRVVAERDEALARLALPTSAVELITQRWEDRAGEAEARVERWAARAEQAEGARDRAEQDRERFRAVSERLAIELQELEESLRRSIAAGLRGDADGLEAKNRLGAAVVLRTAAEKVEAGAL